MPGQVIESSADRRFGRRARELKTVTTMLQMYCRAHAHNPRGKMCSTCKELLAYAKRRLERCIFGDTKPTCARCTVHCYRSGQREHMRAVMRWAGPRMLICHPVLAVRHLIDAWNSSPRQRRTTRQHKKE